MKAKQGRAASRQACSCPCQLRVHDARCPRRDRDASNQVRAAAPAVEEDGSWSRLFLHNPHTTTKKISVNGRPKQEKKDRPGGEANPKVRKSGLGGIASGLSPIRPAACALALVRSGKHPRDRQRTGLEGSHGAMLDGHPTSHLPRVPSHRSTCASRWWSRPGRDSFRTRPPFPASSAALANKVGAGEQVWAKQRPYWTVIVGAGRRRSTRQSGSGPSPR